MVKHFFTVDVEEHFQVSALERVVPRSRWDREESRVERNVDALLHLLERFEVRGTFFVLGWIARKHPILVKRIACAGHEIASHGWGHRRITEITPRDFRTSVRSSKDILEGLTGRAVLGYRAPSFSILPGMEWALDLLVEEGYRYDSSLFPIRRPGYGYPGIPADPHWNLRPAGPLLELPPATFRKFGVRVPAAGGGYLRHFPISWMRRAFREAGARGVPATFYIHPWEIDPGQPRYPAPLLTRMRHYGNLHRTSGLLERILGEFSFRTIESYLKAPARIEPGPRTERVEVSSPVARAVDSTFMSATARAAST